MKILITKQLFLFFLFLNPLALTLFVNEDDFVGVKEETYTWNTQFDKKPMINMFDDMFNDEVLAEILTDEYFEMNNFRNDSVQWQILVKSISTNFEYYFKGDAHYYKKLRINLYELREKDEIKTRHTISNNILYKLYEPNYEYQAKLLNAISEVPIMNLHFFYANNMDYEKYSIAINKELDSDTYETSLVSVNLDFQNVGYKIVYSNDEFEDMNDAIFSMKYNDDGILYETLLTYDDEIIYKFELKDFNIIWHENWIFLTLTMMGLAALGVLYLWIKFKLR